MDNRKYRWIINKIIIYRGRLYIDYENDENEIIDKYNIR